MSQLNRTILKRPHNLRLKEALLKASEVAADSSELV